MVRRLRFYEKKRGDRRTGSKILGSAGEAVFFGILLLLGCGGLVAAIVLLVVPEWRVNHEFVEATCEIEEARLRQIEGEEGPLYRPEFKIVYQVGGKPQHSSWTYDVGNDYSGGRTETEAVLGHFVVGRQYPCWYDPAEPYSVVLVRGYDWWVWLVFSVPVSFIVIGGGGFLYAVLNWGKSTERRAAMARRAQRGELLVGNGHSRHKFPNVPDGSDITNSPGTKLRFRLPIVRSPGWTLFATAVACLFWNGIVWVFVVNVLRGHLGGQPDWMLTLFLVPFVAVGIALVAFFIRQLLLTTGVGPTLVEISDHPLHAGDRCRLFVSQSGRLRISSLAVLLVCEEATTYRQGTDTRTETREVCRQEVFRREGFEVRHGVPFEAECGLAVPGEAMHSFKAAHNEINWKLVVEGDAAGWPNYKRVFPVIIHPTNGRTQR